jgi:diadenosine tetraphosphate (Ap4A) HIT family hydrolase
MLRRAALVRAVSEECTDSINRVTRIGELGKTLAVPSSSIHVIPEDGVLHSRRRENLTASNVTNKI